ncbi:LOW QUALITY PROTEIN: uncharacterized protein M8220_002467 [Acridotheres tristis]
MVGQSVFVVATDFGTSYSGYGFSLASGADQIHQVYWGTEHGFKTRKTLMSILFNQKQEFKYFGYDAVMKYKSLPSSQADTRCFLQNFKMQLYSTALCWFGIVHGFISVCLFSQTPGYLRAFLSVLQGLTRPLRCRINQSTRAVPGKASGPLFGGWGASLKTFLPKTAGNDVVCYNITSGAVGLLQKLVEIGESVNIHEVDHYNFFPIELDQTKVVFAFYCTKNQNARVDEEGMEQLGFCIVPSPDTWLERHHRLKVEMKFGLTEFKSACTDVTSQKSQTVIMDFSSYKYLSY